MPSRKGSPVSAVAPASEPVTVTFVPRIVVRSAKSLLAGWAAADQAAKLTVSARQNPHGYLMINKTTPSAQERQLNYYFNYFKSPAPWAASGGGAFAS
jgi:hypothetical protein